MLYYLIWYFLLQIVPIVISVIIPLTLSQKKLMIIVDDEPNKSNQEHLHSNWYTDNTYNSKYKSSAITNFPQTKKVSHLPPIEKYSSFSDDSESINTHSKHRNGHLHGLKNLPLNFRQAMNSDNNIIHYHEHEHVHKHKNLSKNPQRAHAAVKHSDNNAKDPYLDQSFESTKNYYHQRDYPNKYGVRTRVKQNLHSYEPNYYEENKEEYQYDFRRKSPKYKRGDQPVNRHRRRPNWRHKYGYKPIG